MATKKPAPVAPRGQKTSLPKAGFTQNQKRAIAGPVNWDAVLENMAQSSTGPFFFVKSPRTRMRLVCLDDDITRFNLPVQTVFKGKAKTKYILFAQLLSSDGGAKGPLDERWRNKIVPVVITTTALKGIISLLAEGYDLFSEADGYGITILRTGTGTDTDYNVNPSPHSIPLAANLEMPEKTLEEYARELNQRNAERNGGSAEAEEGSEASW